MNVTVAVRSVGERTADKCAAHLIDVFGKENVFEIKNVIPFSEAVAQTFKIGLSRQKKWTLAVDADVFLFPDKITSFFDIAEGFIQNRKYVYCIEGKLFDKFSQSFREVGCHLYNTSALTDALPFATGGENDIRPETYVKIQMANQGWGYYSCNRAIGIHDFFQAPADIIRKSILHCKKHPDIANWIDSWRQLSKVDDDFKFALIGKNIFDSLSGDKLLKVDMKYMEELTAQSDNLVLSEMGELTEDEINVILSKYNIDWPLEDAYFKLVFSNRAALENAMSQIYASLDNSGAKTVCYGIGIGGEAAFNMLSRLGINVDYFADTYKHGTEFHGEKVLSPAELAVLDNQVAVRVLITNANSEIEICNSLKKLGIRGQIIHSGNTR